MDRLFYCAPHLSQDLVKGHWYHSTYLAGGPVLCAGNIKFVDGAVTYIDNNSGHYQPTPYKLLNALWTLRAAGMSLDGIMVGISKLSAPGNDWKVLTKKFPADKVINALANPDLLLRGQHHFDINHPFQAEVLGGQTTFTQHGYEVKVD